MNLESIPVQITQAGTAMPDAMLLEIAALLRQLTEKKIAGSIDLHGLPMSDEDRNCLQERLGRGEVSAHIEVNGLTEVWETAYTGVWWIRHQNRDNRIIAEEISVTQVPEILVSPKEDIGAAAKRLTAETDEEARHV